MLLVSEHGDARRRGFWASWPQTGAPAGQLPATGVLSLLTAALLADHGSSTPIAPYVIAASLLTVVAVAMAEETRHRDLADVAPPGGTRGKADASPAARDAHAV